MNSTNFNVGIVGTGIYIPSGRMTSAEISKATNDQWSKEAIEQKLGIIEKSIPGKEDGTQEMGARAALDCLNNTGIQATDIDLIISIGEEWKEYPLTTTGIYIQHRIGAINAWAFDLQQRCCTTVAAMKIAKDMILIHPFRLCLILLQEREQSFYKETMDTIFYLERISSPMEAWHAMQALNLAELKNQLLA